MTRQKITPFASDYQGRIFIQLEYVTSFLVAMIDGLSVTTISGSDAAWLDVEVAIDWCRKESEHHGKERYEKLIETLEIAKRKNAEEFAAKEGPYARLRQP